MVDLPTLPYDLDDDIITRTLDDGWPRVRIYEPTEIAVVIGRGGRQELELNTAKISPTESPSTNGPAVVAA